MWRISIIVIVAETTRCWSILTLLINYHFSSDHRKTNTSKSWHKSEEPSSFCSEFTLSSVWNLWWSFEGSDTVTLTPTGDITDTRTTTSHRNPLRRLLNLLPVRTIRRWKLSKRNHRAWTKKSNRNNNRSVPWFISYTVTYTLFL